MKKSKFTIITLFSICSIVYLSSCAMVNEVQLSSEPPGAKVYLVPLYQFEKDTTIASDDAKLAEFQVSEGLTPVTTRALEKRYVVVFDLNGKKLITRIDIIQGQTNQAKVVFQ